jgi:hypothetical protein
LWALWQNLRVPRPCQNIAGVTHQLALFDAPIDPGLLMKAQAAGVDIGSVLSDITVPLPNYRFIALYAQALDFVNALRAYGALVLSAIEKSDAAALATLLALAPPRENHPHARNSDELSLIG